MMPASRVAFFDIGTNTILLLVAEIGANGSFTVLDDVAEIARLGQGVDVNSRISADAESRALGVLRHYLTHCRQLHVQECVAVGTSALRDAANSTEVRARLKAQLGLEIRVLSGHEEAAYSFLAVQRGLQTTAKAVLVVDIGGGSTEFIWGDAGGMSRAISINIGSVRLTERFLRSDPVTDEECARMVTFIDQEVGRLGHRDGRISEGLSLVGIAGTFTTLAAVEKRLMRYSHYEVHGSLLTLSEVTRQVKLYQSIPVAERRQIPGLEPKRADVILAGAWLVQRIMQAFGVQQITVSDQGVRYGLLYERLGATKNC
ncbi:MAG TPA: Ppx/GppA phosphatase family protein [Terriglobales bacterium]|nr:Ppx/GppA phosphatase family protein [Terriglobales bacterium]